MKNILKFGDIVQSIDSMNHISGLPNMIHFGAGFDNLIKKFIEEDYSTYYHGIDVDEEKLNLVDSIKNYQESSVKLSHQSMQDFLSESDETTDVILITGVFDKIVYDENQYNFIVKTIEECFKRVSNKVVFTLKQNPTEDFEYNITYIFTVLSLTYDKLTIQKFSEEGNNQYIFSILK